MYIKPQISIKYVLIAVFIMLAIHLMVLGSYSEYSRKVGNQERYHELTQQILSIVHLTDVVPPSQLAKEFAALQQDKFTVTLGLLPTSRYQIPITSFWEISRTLYRNKIDKNVSIQLRSGMWLNFEVMPLSDDHILRILLIILESLLVIVIIFSVILIQRFIGPLKNFKYAAERLSMDMKADPLPEDGPLVVQQTAQALNVMQKRIRELLQDRTQMLAAISHDLRTPLTRLKLRAQFMTDMDQLEKMMNDLDEMEAMIEQILSYARDTIEHEVHVWLDLHALVRSIADDMSDVGYQVTFASVSERIPFKGRLLALKRAITNIITNATKYGRSAHIEITQTEQATLLIIDDEGPGIPEHELKAVLAPFYRVDRARSSDTGGTGLGLSIAYDVISAHHGSIELLNRPEGGLRVIITLPKESI